MRTITVMIPVLLAILSVPVLIGFYVYDDADKRGMNAVLWTLIAVFAPSLIGFIIYLLVRGNYDILECSSCGEEIEDEYLVCPNCGARLKSTCPNCKAPVEPEWKVCPMCAVPLPEYKEDMPKAARRKDSKLWKILIAIIAVPIVLMVLSFATLVNVRSTRSTGTCELSFKDYQIELDSPEIYEKVQSWVDSLETEKNHAYALQYEYPEERQTERFYLIYVPGAGSSYTGVGQSSGLFGTSMNLELHGNSGSDTLINIIASGDSKKAPKLKIKLDGKKIPCEVTEVDYNPTVFGIE